MMSTFEPIQRLHHFAWRCRDAEETRHFYQDILGLPLTHVIRGESLERAKTRLRACGVEVLGVTDHGFVNSIYFFDPNGIRLELTVDTPEKQVSKSDLTRARQDLDAWTAEKARRSAAAASASRSGDAPHA